VFKSTDSNNYLGSSSLGDPNFGAPQGLWVVNVGSDNGALVFSPSTINVQAGDAVQFIFYGRVSLHGVGRNTLEF
jgi:plastocyanin